MAIDPDIAAMFNVLKKDKDWADKVWQGDDLSMDSVPPFGIPSGIPEMDLQIGKKGGYPVTKIIEFYGFERCGKTTAALQAAAEWQKHNGLVFFIDTEKSFDPKRAAQLGVDVSSVIVMEADTIEMVFGHIIQRIIEPAKKLGWDRPVLIIVDSVNGVPTEADAEAENIDKSDRPGFEGKQIKRGCRKLNPLLSDYAFTPTIIFINHAYDKIGAHQGTPIQSGGGHGIKFYASVRVSFQHISQIRESKEERTGQKIVVTITKLKGAALQYDKMELQLDNDYGFNKYLSLLDAMISSVYAYRKPSSQTTTLFYGTEAAEDIKTVDFREWVETHGGYDTVYIVFRKWCIKHGKIEPWGNKDA